MIREGEEVLEVARRMLKEADNLNRIGNDYSTRQNPVLRIAVSHAHARYALPQVVSKFAERYPHTRLSLRQGNPTQISDWLGNGEVDFSIATAPEKSVPDIVFLPIYTVGRVILTPIGHPLLENPRPSLKKVARYPLITYGEEFSYYTNLVQTFTRAGLSPDIVLTATDVDVIKRYVKLGLGIAIITSLAYDPDEDKGLGTVDVSHLFDDSKVQLGLRKGIYLSKYGHGFLHLFAPDLDSATIRQAIFAVPGKLTGRRGPH